MMQQEVVDNYDVLLSFRGPDVRQGFLSVFYDQLNRAGICVFRDDDELIPGTRIDTIFEAIANSMICVPIFSRNFATSKWCLREVTCMVQLGKDVAPISYDVTVYNVRLGTDQYVSAIEQQQLAVEQGLVEQWKNALQAVAIRRGMELQSTKFVRMVLVKLKPQEAVSYDVYPSFRGPDVRQGFFNVLYSCLTGAGIRVFRDEDDIAPGAKISTILESSLPNSKICLPIFSKSFASNKWCLREVALMVELEKDIIPIFYDVTPDNVKLETQKYLCELERHHKSVGPELIEQWASALKTVEKIKGVELRGTSYVEFCHNLAQSLLVKLKLTKRYNISGLVGMNDQVESAIELLKLDSPDVRYLGIHGMGGISKITLARFILSALSQFPLLCFHKDIRNSSGRYDLEYLEQQLRQKLNPKYIINSNLSKHIKERFHIRKVRIVLDDVDKLEQIEKLAGEPSWFGPGSRILITTRNTDVLIVRSRDVPAQEVIDRLKISFGALEDYQKQVFLDIACFFIGTEMSNAFYLRRARNLYPHLALPALCAMSLVKITDKKEFWMHDQLRDLGRKIARDQSSRPRRRTRLWVHEEALGV